MSQDRLSFLLVLLVLAALILGVALVGLRVHIKPELSRKFVHIGMGSVAVAFPWMFSSATFVSLLAVLACLAFVVVRYVPFLHNVLGGVRRESEGEFYFSCGVAFAYYFSNGEPVLYCPPILMLAFGDSLAAIVGEARGRHLFTTDENPKSWEGSLAFTISSFVMTYSFLAVFSQLPMANVLVISILLSVIGFMSESISFRGIDNFLIPVVGVMVMAAFHELELVQLYLRIVVLVVLLLIAFSFKRCSTVNESSLIGSALFLYMIWILAG